MSVPSLPRLRVPRLPSSPFDGGDWEQAAVVGPFLLSHGRSRPRQGVSARLGADDAALYVRFDCEDSEPWGTMRQRDDPIYEEEVVEVFLAPGTGDPLAYFEYEVSPTGVLFDARIENPHARRSDMRIHTDWDCAGIRWAAGLVPGGWWAALALPGRRCSAGLPCRPSGGQTSIASTDPGGHRPSSARGAPPWRTPRTSTSPPASGCSRWK
jgi:hypothetical protein